MVPRHGGPLLWLLLAALAQETLPQVEQAAPAVYDAALLPDVGASVLLEVEIDAQGAVGAVRVVEGTDPGLDRAVVTAMRDFRFTPARDAAGQAVPSVIQYRFQLRREEVVSVSLTGRVTTAGGAPLAGVTVVATHDGQRRTATSGLDGWFSWGGLAPGTWEVAVEAPGYRAPETRVEVKDGQVAELRLRAAPVGDPAVEVIDIYAERPAVEVIERPIRRDELRYLPGTAGDIVRAVQNMPGVARAPLGIGQLIIRGKSPEDARYTIDGMEVPAVFHFTGLTTVIASDLVDDVNLLPGGWGVRYGRNLGGRVDLRMSSELPERSTGFASIDLFQVAAYGNFRADERTAVMVAGRRSYVDAVLTPLLSDDEQAFRAPRYWDGQLRVLHRLPGGGSVDAMLFGADDRFVSGPRDEAGDPVAALGLHASFLQGRVSWQTPVSGGWNNELSLTAGPDAQVFQLSGEDAAYERRWRVDLREELTRKGPQGGLLRLGLDMQAGTQSFRFAVDGWGPEEQADTAFFAPALYVEPGWVRGPATVTAGLRADLLTYGEYTTWSLDPRLSTRLKLGDHSAVRFALGRHTQMPTPRVVLPQADGTPDLKPPWSLQGSVGLSQRLPAGFSFDLAVYYDQLFGLVVGREERFRFFTTPPSSGPYDTYPYANEGTGHALGVELLLRWQTHHAAAWLSATFSRSFRTGRDGVTEPFEYDQPFVLSAIGTGKLPRGWRLGGRVRVASGSPYTPIIQRIYSHDLRAYWPVYGEQGSARLPTFFALDLRVDKSWTFHKWMFSLYLDVQNVTNTRNIEVIDWSWDFSEEGGVRGLPILPVFGLRWEG